MRLPSARRGDARPPLQLRLEPFGGGTCGAGLRGSLVGLVQPGARLVNLAS